MDDGEERKTSKWVLSRWRPSGCVQQPDLCSYCKRAGSYTALGNLAGPRSLSHWASLRSKPKPKALKAVGCSCPEYSAHFPSPATGSLQTRKQLVSLCVGRGPAQRATGEPGEPGLPGRWEVQHFFLTGHWAEWFPSAWRTSSTPPCAYWCLSFVSTKIKEWKIKLAPLDGKPGSYHLFWLHCTFKVIDGVTFWNSSSKLLLVRTVSFSKRNI